MVTPQQGRLELRLAAILAADIAGYRRLVQTDDTGTVCDLEGVSGDAADGRPVRRVQHRPLPATAPLPSSPACCARSNALLPSNRPEGAQFGGRAGATMQFHIGVNGHVRCRVSAQFVNCGEQELKNISRLVRVLSAIDL
jgi:hypothetical protein